MENVYNAILCIPAKSIPLNSTNQFSLYKNCQFFPGEIRFLLRSQDAYLTRKADRQINFVDNIYCQKRMYKYSTSKLFQQQFCKYKLAQSLISTDVTELDAARLDVKLADNVMPVNYYNLH